MFTSALKTFFGSGVVATVTDAFFNLVTLLLPGNGTNGAQNNTFLDSSSNNFTITRNGNTTQGSFSPFSQTGWSNYFNGATTSGPFISASYSTTNFDWFTSGQDFTLECWVYPIDLATFSYTEGADVISRLTGNVDVGGTINYWSFGPISDGKVRLHYFNGATVQVTSTSTVTANTWNHIAFTKTSSGITIFVNGTATTPTAVSGTPQSSVSYPLVIGRVNNASINGYVSNYRILKNVTPPYSGSYTVPTLPLTDISGTKILTAQSNRFVDSSSVANALTVSGSTVSVQAFSPFLPTAAYSAATVGGSGYFDGTGDYLSVATNAALTVTGNVDASIEFWVYPITGSGVVVNKSGVSGSVYANYAVSVNSNGSISFFLGNSGSPGSVVTTVSTSAGTVPFNAWSHVVCTKTYVGGGSVNNYRVMINGVLSSNNTQNNPSDGNPGALTIGFEPNGSEDINAYISQLRIFNTSIPAAYQTSSTTNGTSIYTVPTTPVVPSTSSICTLFTNAGITDATAKNVLETVGNASISTTQSKFGGSSMFFDGTGDYLSATPRIQSNAVGSGNATIEMWVYTSNSSSSLKCLVDTRSAQNTDTGFGIYQIANNVVIYGAGVKGNAASQLTGNAWVHLAVTRANTTNYVFIGGTLYNTFSYGNTLTSSNVTIGSDVVGSNAFTGYIDDLRITNGLARYTANFTPTTTAFPLQ